MATDPFKFDPSEYRMAAAAIEQAFPALWRICYPRRYNDVSCGQYDSPKAVARSMMDALLNFHSYERVGATEQEEALWASTMVKEWVPTYYLSRNMGIALTNTTPPDVIDCLTISAPFPAAAFMLPKGTLDHGIYGPISFVAYTRNFGGTSIRCPHPNPAQRFDLNCVNDQFTVFVRSVSGTMLHWTYDTGIRMVNLKDDAELRRLQERYAHSSRLGPKSQEFSESDILAMIGSIKLLFNILLLMESLPETVEAARLEKRIKGTHIEYWQPHVIGRTYKLRYERPDGAPVGTHASPSLHRVAGFWREQPYGPREQGLRKRKLIHPYWRGGSFEEKEAAKKGIA